MRLITEITSEELDYINSLTKDKVAREVIMEETHQYDIIPDLTWYDNESVNSLYRFVKANNPIVIDFEFDEYLTKSSFIPGLKANDDYYDLIPGDIVLINGEYIAIILFENEKLKNVKCTKLGFIEKVEEKAYLRIFFSYRFTLGYNK